MDLHNRQQWNRHEAWRGTHNRWNFHCIVWHTKRRMEVTEKHMHRACSLLLPFHSQTHTHTRIYSGQTWPSSDLNISGHAALWVPTGHIVSKCHNPETEGWKWVEGQGDQMKTGGGGNQREEHSKAKGVCSVCPRRRSERQRPSHYFRVCGSRQQTLRATNPAFTATYWGMRRGANTGENIVYYWETSGNGVLSVFSASVVLKRITLNI